MLRVEGLFLFENYFPDLTNADRPENRRLPLRGGGLFLHSHHYLPGGVEYFEQKSPTSGWRKSV